MQRKQALLNSPAYQAARRDILRAATAKRKPLYIALVAMFEQGEIGNYWAPTITPIKDTPPADLIETAKALWV
jgi:hypothetical protein